MGPGSHKSNFKMPNGMVDGAAHSDFRQTVTKAGDVVLFSEGTVHGALPWNSDEQRRVALFRFAPATNCYGRSYLNWPQTMYDDLDDAQRSVLEPPYANRLDQPNIDSNKTVVITTRAKAKKTHDKVVFGTNYF